MVIKFKGQNRNLMFKGNNVKVIAPTTYDRHSWGYWKNFTWGQLANITWGQMAGKTESEGESS